GDHVARFMRQREAANLIIDVIAPARVGRANHDEFARRLQMPSDGSVIFASGEIFRVEEDVEPTLRSVEIFGRFVSTQRILERTDKSFIFARIADEHIVKIFILQSRNGCTHDQIPCIDRRKKYRLSEARGPTEADTGQIRTEPRRTIAIQADENKRSSVRRSR